MVQFNWSDDKSIQEAWKDRYSDVSTKSTPTDPNYNEIISKYVKKAIDDTKKIIEDSDNSSQGKLDDIFNKIENDLNREFGEIDVSEEDFKDEINRDIDNSRGQLAYEDTNHLTDDEINSKHSSRTFGKNARLFNAISDGLTDDDIISKLEAIRSNSIKQLTSVEKDSIKKIYKHVSSKRITPDTAPSWLDFLLRDEDGYKDNEDLSDSHHYAIIFAYITELAIKIFQDELYQASRIVLEDFIIKPPNNFPKLKLHEDRSNLRDRYTRSGELTKISDSYRTEHYRYLVYGYYTYKQFKEDFNSLLNRIFDFSGSINGIYENLYQQIGSYEKNQNLILFSVLKGITDKDTNYNKTKITESGYNIQDFKTIGDAKSLSFAYENKYMFKLNLPKSLQNYLSSNHITDSPYIVSTSIPSISLDSIETKLNNRIVKSLGSMRHDTFSMTFRDTPNRDYYKMFLNWFNICYYEKDSRWNENIRLYNYPSEYKTTMKVGLLYNHLIQLVDNDSKISKGTYSSGPNFNIGMKKDGTIGSIDKHLKDIKFYEKLDNTITNVNASSTTSNEQNTVLGNIERDLLTVSEYQFPIIVEYAHLYPTNIGDMQMQSASNEIITFDVTFEYSNPIKYTIMDSGGSTSSFEL